MKKSGIYKITSPTSKIYIGQSRNILKRINHYKNLKCIGQPKLYASIKKYGWNNHNLEIICECGINELISLEKHYIKEYDSFNSEHGMNLTSGGDGFCFTEDTRKKLSEAHKGKKHSKETKRRMSEAHKGKTHTREHNINQGNSLRGIKRSDETKRKISTASKGKICSDEFKKKISNTLKGIKRSNETKRKIGLAKKGNKYCIGLTHSDETKKKISESLRKYHEARKLKENNKIRLI